MVLYNKERAIEVKNKYYESMKQSEVTSDFWKFIEKKITEKKKLCMHAFKQYA